MSRASYETLRAHLSYLKLTRAEELLAAHIEAARKDKLSHVAFLERLLKEEVEATQARRLRGWGSHTSRSKSASPISTSTSSPRSTRR
jgi:hypothetical protein